MKDLTIKANISLREAMLRLDQTAEKCLFVVDDSEVLIGAITDGDVRRAILSGADLDSSIENFFNTNPIKLQLSSTELDDDYYVEDVALSVLKRNKVEVIPIVDNHGVFNRYITWGDLFTDSTAEPRDPISCPIIIMAGGLGSRLEPFTKVLPKPLIPVHEKPIIEHIIDRFVEYGASDFRLTVNYKSRILKAYFEDREPEYDISFINEEIPMGTAGSLQFLKDEVNDSFFVTNCDIIINADYKKILEFHKDQGHALTLVGSTVHYQIPYGTCVLNNNGSLERIDEKPSYDFLVNTGMYVLEPSILSLIPEQGVYHITQLMEDVIKSGLSVGVFPVSEDAWIDIGQWKEYQKAVDKL